MILTAYFDESGTHDGSPYTVMAAVMGHGCQWTAFQRDFNNLKRSFGFSVFHAKEVRAGKGEFANWSAERVQALINGMMLSSANLMEAVTFVVSNSDYEKYYQGGETPRKIRLDTRYGLSFRSCLSHLSAEAVRRLGQHKKFGLTKLNVIVEDGHKNVGDVKRIFDEMKAEHAEFGLNLLGTLTFCGKHGADPLMIADYLAFGTFKLELDGRTKSAHADGNDSLGVAKTRMTHLYYDPEGLASLKSQLIRNVPSSRTRRDGP
jgi:hypothetical protein